MLQSKLAVELYENYAKDMPIFDYHCHLSPKQIAENHEFEDLTELWLDGDHYKWRALRANGIDEQYITGNSSSKEKFKAWAQTVPSVVGNPLYHWTHLELSRYFGITEPLSENNWEAVYEEATKQIQEKHYTTRHFIEASNVVFVGTTDNPTDDLRYHIQIKEDASFKPVVAPTFRPDEFFTIEQPEVFKEMLGRLSHVSGIEINNFEDFLCAIKQRVDFFDTVGCKASDHSFSLLKYVPATTQQLSELFERCVQGEEASEEARFMWQTGLFIQLCRLYSEKDWVTQIHFGAIRNNNTRLFQQLGRDIGTDSIMDQGDIALHLNPLLDALDRDNELPKMVLYNLNPTANDIVAATAANFQSNPKGIRSKIQFGAGWWFNDTKRGMLNQMDTLADHGLLMNFIGMLTDSRSFVSYARHDYFRRIFCNYIAQKVLDNEIPKDDALLKQLIENVCYNNVKQYFKA